MNKWIPLDNYHKNPKGNEPVILTDGEDIYYNMVWIDGFTYDGKTYPDGWYHANGVAPIDIKPTHWLVLQLP